MRPFPAFVVVLAIACAGGAGLGCHKSSETEAAEATRASIVKVQKEQRTLFELQHGTREEGAQAFVESQDADERASREQGEVAVAIDRERDRYSAALTKEIAWLERRANDLEKDAASSRGALKVEKDQDIAAARAWANHLREELEAVELTTPDADWAAVKTRIERDLDENRPVSIPRTFEKSYGI